MSQLSVGLPLSPCSCQCFSKVNCEIGNLAHFPLLWVRDLVGVAWLGKSWNVRWCQGSQGREITRTEDLHNLGTRFWEVSLTNPLNATPDLSVAPPPPPPMASSFPLVTVSVISYDRGNMQPQGCSAVPGKCHLQLMSQRREKQLRR